MRSGGKVFLVGGGPGDPGLLTLRGAELLRCADAVVFDALVSPEVLDLVAPSAARIDAGKRGHEGKTLGQEEISQLLVDLARQGQQVVRLKGGDPFVFGRGGEEASACAAAGIPFEVVPGVSAALAAPAYAGIPVSDRRHAASFAVVTGHKDPTATATQVRWRELSLGADTLVVLMGLRTLEAVVEELVRHGRPPETPAAAISNATTPRQRVVTAPLHELPARVREADLGAPVTIVVGEVVTLRESLAWFERLPLFGRRVLVTRAGDQATGMVAALRAAGAEAVVLPLIRIVACEDQRALDEALCNLERFDVLLLTSGNAARILAAHAAARGVSLDRSGLEILCVGPATAAAAREARLPVHAVPCRRFDADGLLAAIRAEGPAAGRRFLLPRSEAARDVLPDGLRADGATVATVALYRPEAAPLDVEGLRSQLREGRLDVLTFTSPSTVRHFLAHLDDEARAAAARSVVAAIGPTTAAALREQGLAAAVVPERATGAALVQALAAHFVEAGGRR